MHNFGDVSDSACHPRRTHCQPDLPDPWRESDARQRSGGTIWRHDRHKKAVSRNLKRFPEDFMFQLTQIEVEALMFQNGIAKGGRGGRRTAPYAFTEQGIAMLSSVLHSDRAAEITV